MNTKARVLTSKGRRFLLRLETSHEPGDYQKYEDLREEIWGFPDDHLAGTRNLMCENYLAEGASVFIGAFREADGGGFPADAAHLVGFSYGFAGVQDKETGFREISNLRFYSQFTGIKPDFQGYGLGVAVKEFQRDVVLNSLGIGTIICTFDPLTAVNAHRNVHQLRMEVQEYRVATYGEYGGLLNRSDVPSDRFLMSWDLTRTKRADEIPSAAAATPVLRVERASIKGRSGALEVDVVRDAVPEPESDLVLVEIPLDFYGLLRETDVEDPEVRRIPVDWRLMTRRVMMSLLDGGYRVVDFLKGYGAPAGNFYVLMKG
jgi:predicted GNAT superfamily acetyltransferase